MTQANSKQRAIGAVACLAMLVPGLFAMNTPAIAQDAPTPQALTVDYSQDAGAFTGQANGTLYGVSSDGSPTQAIVNGFKQGNMAVKAPDGRQHPNGDAIKTAKTFFNAGGTYMFVEMQDFYQSWSYDGTKFPGNEGNKYNTSGAQELIPGLGKVPGDDGQYNLDLSSPTFGQYTNTGNGVWDYEDVCSYQVERVAKEVSQLVSPQAVDNYVFIPFNEPNGNWYTGDANNPVFSRFLSDWDKAYRGIQEGWKAAKAKGYVTADHAMVAGPTMSFFQSSYKNFLQHTVSQNDTPDFMIWHELGAGSLQGFKRNLDTYRQYEKDAGVTTPLRININEWGTMRDMGVGGQVVQWLAMFEKYKIFADASFWNYSGNMSDGMSRTNAANAGWWMNKWYGDMNGSETYEVTPPYPATTDTLQGIGTFDAASQKATVLYGGANSGEKMNIDNTGNYFRGIGARVPVTVNLKNLNKVMGDVKNVDVQVRETPLVGQEGIADSPRVVNVAKSVPVVDGSVSVTTTSIDRYAGYQLIVTPSQDVDIANEADNVQAVEAEDTKLTDADTVPYDPITKSVYKLMFSGNAQVENFTKPTSQADWKVSVSKDGSYRFQSIGATKGQNPGEHELFVDGKDVSVLQYDADQGGSHSGTYRGSAQAVIRLTAGEHTLSVRASRDGKKLLPGSDVSLDKFLLYSVSDSQGRQDYRNYPASEMRLSNGAKLEYQEGVRGYASISGKGYAEVYANSWESGYNNLSVAYNAQAGQTLNVAVNGSPIATFTAAQNGKQTSTITTALSQGINEITLSTEGAPVQVASVAVESNKRANAARVLVEAEASGVTRDGGATVVLSGKGSNATGRAYVANLGKGGTISIPRTASSRYAKLAKGGTYVAVIHYSNSSLADSSVYSGGGNPDPLDLKLDMSVSGQILTSDNLRYTYSNASFWDRSTVITLPAGDAPIVIGNAQGVAPNIDNIAFYPQVVQ